MNTTPQHQTPSGPTSTSLAPRQNSRRRLPPAPPPDFEAKLAAVLMVKSADRRTTRWMHLGLLLLGPALLAVLLMLLGGFEAGDRPLSFVFGTTIGWVGMTLASGWLALGRGRGMGGPPTRVLIIAAVAGPLLLMGWLLIWNRVYSPSACPADIDPLGFRCDKLIIAMSAVMFTAFAAIRRFGDPVHPKSSGAVMGMSAASAAGLVLNLRCTCATPLHVAFGHVLPIALTSVAGVALGAWLLRLRRTPKIDLPADAKALNR